MLPLPPLQAERHCRVRACQQQSSDRADLVPQLNTGGVASLLQV